MKEEDTDLKSETPINYIDEVDAVHPRLNSQGHLLNIPSTVLYEKEVNVIEHSSRSNHEKNYNPSHRPTKYDEILLSSEPPNGNLSDDRELNFLEEKSMENFPIDYQEAESGISSQSLIKLRIKQ